MNEQTAYDLNDEDSRTFKCSKCHYEVGDLPLPREPFNYCPNCGRKILKEAHGSSNK